MEKSLFFEKYSGTGNSFLICDLRKNHNRRSYNKIKHRLKSFVQKACDTHFGVGADGVVFLSPVQKSNTHFVWDFFNADGSKAEMCGNAARCVGHAAYRFNSKYSQLQIRTKAGDVSVELNKISKNENHSFATVQMPTVTGFEQNILLNRKIHYSFVNTGVPHAVIEAANLKCLFQDTHGKKEHEYFKNLNGLVREIRALKKFRKAGTNVTFFQRLSKSAILSLTFERGVHGFTLACGTGAVAAAIVFLNGGRGTVLVKVPGGNLKVETKKQNPILFGPSEFLGEMTIPFE